ncbi:hypothetical protein [Pseudomonas sp. QD4]|uniref:hypothetical protein n=1 Tax=Pseudomonas sp. QD4 TaxID=3368618 RepID=UPI003B9EBEDF
MFKPLGIETIDPAATKLHRAGDIGWFPSGTTMYLAPLQLLTDASSHSPYGSDFYRPVFCQMVRNHRQALRKFLLVSLA